MTDYVVSSGVVSRRLALGPADSATVLSGGTTVSTANGGLELILSGGVASDSFVSTGGSESVALGGVAAGAYIDGGSQVVFGVADGTTLQGVSDGNGFVVAQQIVEGAAAGTIASVGGSLVVDSGGVASKIQVLGGGDIFIDSGGAATGVTLSGLAGETATGVLTSGGVISNATVLDNGLLTVYQGGSLDNGVVGSGGTVDLAQAVASGAVLVFSDQLNGGVVLATSAISGLTVSSGGAVDLDFNVMSGATLDLPAGVVFTTSVTVSAGGTMSGHGLMEGLCLDEGVLDSVVIGDDSGSGAAITEVFGGAVASNTDVTPNGVIFVFAGGETFGSLIDGGSEQVLSGGVASSSVLGGPTEPNIISFVQQILSSGATAMATVVGSSAKELASSGASVSGTTVLAGGVEILSAGAMIAEVTVRSGGAVLFGLAVGSGDTVVARGRTVSAATTISGVTVLSGGLIEYGFTVQGGGALDLTPGALLSGTDNVIDAGGVVSGPGLLLGYATNEGVISGVTVGADGLLTARGGADNGVHLTSGSDEYVSSAGIASGTVVGSGAAQLVSAGGSALAVTVEAGGFQNVKSGSVTSGDVVRSGGLERLYAGAAVTNLTVRSGGVLGIVPELSAGVVASVTTTTVMGTTHLSGATLLRGAALKLQGATIDSGAVLDLEAGAALPAITSVFLGGLLSGAGTVTGDVEDYGVVSGAAISGYGYIGAGGVGVGLSAVSGGQIEVDQGGVASAAIARGSASQILIDSGGIAEHSVIKSGGVAYVASGGIMVGVTVSSGGTVSGPGAISGVLIDEGAVDGAVLEGIVAVSSGGLESGGTIASHGVETVRSGGVTVGTIDLSAGRQTVLAGGVASGVSVAAGGVAVDDGALVYAPTSTAIFAGILSGSGVVVQSGPGALVLSGATGAFTGAAVISGGTVELADASGVGKGVVVWASPTASATLRIDATDRPAAGAVFSSTLSDFDQTNDSLDLSGLAFVSGTTATVSDSILKVTDGGRTYDFALAGMAATSYGVTADGAGGSLVTATANGASVLVQAIAGFGIGAGSLQEGVRVSAGALAETMIAPVASAAALR